MSLSQEQSSYPGSDPTLAIKEVEHAIRYGDLYRARDALQRAVDELHDTGYDQALSQRLKTLAGELHERENTLHSDDRAVPRTNDGHVDSLDAGRKAGNDADQLHLASYRPTSIDRIGDLSEERFKKAADPGAHNRERNLDEPAPGHEHYANGEDNHEPNGQEPDSEAGSNKRNDDDPDALALHETTGGFMPALMPG